jgi:hypothetical protein
VRQQIVSSMFWLIKEMGEVRGKVKQVQSGEPDTGGEDQVLSIGLRSESDMAYVGHVL